MLALDYYDHLLANIPFGAEKVVLRALSGHIGLDHAIQKPDLIAASKRLGATFKDERQLRIIIVRLRKAGVPVCASSGESGSFLAASLEEYREFRGREYIKKIIDMRETVDAMDQHIRRMFPQEYQDYQREKSNCAGQPPLI